MKRTILRTAVAGIATIGAAGVLAPAVADAAPIVSNQIITGGWGNTFPDERGQAGKHSATKVQDNDGSLELETTAAVPRKASYRAADKVKLADARTKPLTFEKTAGNANWQIRVTGANVEGADGFLTLVWTAPNEAGAPSAGGSDQWWSTRALPGFPRGAKGTLAELTAAANSDGHTTVVDHYGISSQPGGAGKVNVDKVTFNGDTTNFAFIGGGTGSLEQLIPSQPN